MRGYVFSIVVGLGLCSVAAPAFAQKPYRAPLDPPRAHYTIEVQIEPATGSISGTATIRLTNSTSEPIHRLALRAPSGADQQLEIKANGAALTFLRTSAGGPLLLDLPESWAPGGKLEVEIDFVGHAFQAGQEKITLTHWYPRLWWGFAVHDDYDVRVEAPDDYAVGATGRLNANGYFHEENVPSFGLFLAKGMQVTESYAGDVIVRAIHTPAASELATLLQATAVDVVDYYRERFGIYPYSSLTIVPGMDRPAGGYPVATGIVAIHGQERRAERPEIHWLWITAHEIGHQYWGEYVLEKDDPGWLWIGMGIYADREYVRARNLSLKKHDDLMARYIEGVRRNLNTTVEIPPDQVRSLGFDHNNVVIHGKGFAIVSALESVLGDDTFDRIYLRCLNEYASRQLGAGDFRRIAEEESGLDLGWFFDAWTRTNLYASYEITSQSSVRAGDRFTSEVTVERLGTMRLPVPVAAHFEDGSMQVKSSDRLLDVNVLRFESSAPLTEARLDPDGELALVIPPPGPPEPPTTLEELEARIRGLPWSDVGPEALSLFEATRTFEPSEPYLWFKLGLGLYDAAHYPEALEVFNRLAGFAGEDPSMSFIAAVWQGHLLDLLERRDEAVEAYQRALELDTGQTMRHDQYGLVINRAWVEARLERPFVRW